MLVFWGGVGVGAAVASLTVFMVIETEIICETGTMFIKYNHPDASQKKTEGPYGF